MDSSRDWFSKGVIRVTENVLSTSMELPFGGANSSKDFVNDAL